MFLNFVILINSNSFNFPIIPLTLSCISYSKWICYSDKKYMTMVDYLQHTHLEQVVKFLKNLK